jgi:hypothetical protein
MHFKSRAHTGPKFCVATWHKATSGHILYCILDSHCYCIMYIQHSTYPFLNILNYCISSFDHFSINKLCCSTTLFLIISLNMKYLCRIFQISVAKFFKKSQNATNAMGSVSPEKFKETYHMTKMFIFFLLIEFATLSFEAKFIF